MKIGFLLPSGFALNNEGNGIRRQALYQADALRALGHEVVLFDGWQAYDLPSFDVIHFFVGGFGTQGVESAPIGDAIRVWAPIIDTNEPNWRYRLAAWLGGVVPKVYTVPAIFRRQGLGSDLVVVRSTHERDRVVQGLGIDAGRVRIVLNGADPATGRAADPARAAALTGGDEPFALHVSAYTQGRKNVRNLIRAVGPTGIKLVIAGSATPGPILDEVRALAGQYPNVRLLGYLAEADRDALYAACRVFCLPSDHEGTGLVALEAAMRGARIVITRNGGTADYFGEHARYVDPDDVAGIGAAVRAAFAEGPDPSIAAYFASRLTWRHSAESLVEAYQATIDARRRAGGPPASAGSHRPSGV